MKLPLLLVAMLSFVITANADLIKPKPPLYFNDETHSVTPTVAHQINEQLAQNERKTSNQLLVCIYDHLPEDAPDLFSFAQANYNAWGVGQKDKNNGAILFVFIKNHKARIHPGYGLEGALPDATTTRIQQQFLVPSMKRGNVDKAITDTVNEMIRVTDPEYKGTGKTVAETPHSSDNFGLFIIIICVAMFALVLFILWLMLRTPKRDKYERSFPHSPPYPSRVRRSGTSTYVPTTYIPTDTGSSFSSDSSYSSPSSSSDSSFSGGGGMSGGGGSDSSW